MELKKPTLEEVKEYFKDAEIVECAYLKKLYDITKNITSDIIHDLEEYWIKVDDTEINLWDKEIGYAKIISYKDYKITKETILKYNMKDEFPEVFTNKLEVGKWYKNNIGSLINYQSIAGGDIFGYGFSRFKEWKNNYIMCGEYTEATPQEVEEALIQEAKKRGYEIGVYALFGSVKDKRKILANDFYFEDNELSMGNDIIFYNGIWAEIIPTITKQQAEEKLGCKIVD